MAPVGYPPVLKNDKIAANNTRAWMDERPVISCAAMQISTVLLFAITISCATLANVAAADLSDPPFNWPSSSIGDTASHVRITTVDRSDGTDRVDVMIAIDRGFHINANPASSEYLIPTMLKITNLTPLRVVYPKGVPFKPKFADEALSVYEGTIEITAEFSPGALSHEHRLFGELTAQACTDQLCLPPADLPLPK
jgi:hypothetical protein